MLENSLQDNILIFILLYIYSYSTTINIFGIYTVL